MKFFRFKRKNFGFLKKYPRWLLNRQENIHTFAGYLYFTNI
jgi:hypothetical protein